MKVPFIDLRAHHAPLRGEILRAIEQVVESGAFAGGSVVSEFESAFATYCGSDHAIGVGNGTEALWLALLAVGVGHGDEVITVPSTFMATAEAITYCGAKPVFVDIDERTYTMDPGALRKAISPKTRAIIPVHLFGHSADLDSIIEIANEHGLPVVEDACQAHGAQYKGKKVGSVGCLGCFSFYPGKNLGAFGEAGAIITDDEELQEKTRMFRDHGQASKYLHSVVGWNCRMDEIQAAVLQIKLRHLDNSNKLRREHAAFYDRAFAGVNGIIPPSEASYALHVYHIYAIRVSNRNEVIRRLQAEGIGCGIHYPVPIHLQGAYTNLNYKRGAFPISERCADEFISLPMFPEISDTQRELVVHAVKEAVASTPVISGGCSAR